MALNGKMCCCGRGECCQWCVGAWAHKAVPSTDAGKLEAERQCTISSVLHLNFDCIISRLDGTRYGIKQSTIKFIKNFMNLSSTPLVASVTSLIPLPTTPSPDQLRLPDVPCTSEEKTNTCIWPRRDRAVWGNVQGHLWLQSKEKIAPRSSKPTVDLSVASRANRTHICPCNPSRLKVVARCDRHRRERGKCEGSKMLAR